MADTAGVRATVRGRVQGVFFRDFTQRHAERLELTGYVRNLPDGSVEVAAEGMKPHLEALLANLKTGSPASRVESIDVSWCDYSGQYTGFSVRR